MDNPWINDPLDYTSDDSISINKSNKLKMREKFVESQKAIWSRNLLSNRKFRPIRSSSQLFGVSDMTMFGRAASRATMPIAIMSSAMGLGNLAVQSSFDRGVLQSGIKSGLDMFTEYAPEVASFAAFGAVEKAITGRFSGEGSARGLFSKIMGRGGGLRRKAIGFAGGLISATITSSLLKPMKEMISGAIERERSPGMEAGIAKKSPETIRGMTTKQIQAAQKQLRGDISGKGFWDAAVNGKVIKWSEEQSNQKALVDIKNELTNQRMEVLNNLADNNKMIIDFYSRE